MTQSKPTLADLNRRVAILEMQQQWLSKVLETYGIKGLWLSPAKAAQLLGISRDRVIAEIRRAETLRALNKKGDLLYGVHYRNVQDPEADEATWQVHVAEFDRFLAIPPDARKL